jgi:hypothetical protein
MNIWFGAKDAPFIQTSGSKNLIRKFNPKNLIRKFNHLPLPPSYLGVKCGGSMEKCGKSANVRISRPMWQIS